MVEPGFVLVASPFTGPFAWTRVAALLREQGIRVAVYGADEPIEPPIVLVGHSGAGAHLPAIASRLPGVERAVFVDALLPHPGRSWAQTVPDAFVARLEALAVDGRLPPWPEWWGEEAMRELVPDDALRGPDRARFGSVLEDGADHQVTEPARGVALAQRAPHDVADDTECLLARVRVGLAHAVDLEDHDRYRSERSSRGCDLLLHEHREVPLVVEPGRGIEGVFVAIARGLQRRAELDLGGAPARLLLQDGIDRGQLAPHRAELVLGLAQLIAVPARFGGECDPGDRGDHAGDTRHDGERGRVGGNAHRAGSERSQATRDGDHQPRILHGRS